MIRVTIFANKAEERQGGKVVVLRNNSGETKFDSLEIFLEECCKKLYGIESEITTGRCFTIDGGEISDLEEIMPNEILYISRGEDFEQTNKTLRVFDDVKILNEKVALLEAQLNELKSQQKRMTLSSALFKRPPFLSSSFDLGRQPLPEDDLLSEPTSGDQLQQQYDDEVVLSPEQSTTSNMSPKEEELLSADRVIVFVNTKSGGQSGKATMSKFKRLLPAEDVIELPTTDPVTVLEKVRNVKNLKVVCAGGDGTVKWILETIDKLKLTPSPPVGVLPLGTGNDIARVFNWGGVYNNESIKKFITAIHHSQGVKLDRWNAEFVDLNTGAKKHFIWSNYLSFGVDAKIALNFHLARNSNPYLFSSHVANRLWYASYGIQSAIESALSSQNVSELVDIEVNGKRLIVTEPMEGIVLLNLMSYAGGCDLWGNQKEERFKPQSFSDGILELVGIKNAAELANFRNGGHATRLAQGSEFKITFKKPKKTLAFQIDGEPWDQPSGIELNVTFNRQANMLARLNNS